jgi:hypothetical protein
MKILLLLEVEERKEKRGKYETKKNTRAADKKPVGHFKTFFRIS